MEKESQAMHYEKAAILRDRIAALTRVQHEQRVIAGSLQDADVIALHREGAMSCVQVFFFRGGQNFGNKSYFPAHAADCPDADILAAFLGQFYVANPPPKLILLSHELPDGIVLEDALSLQGETRVELQVPVRGEKKAVMEQAVINAKGALARHISEQAGNTAMLEKLAELFGLDAAPQRMEVYDNSHIAGTHMVGAMICADAQGFAKKHYRRFNIRSIDLTPGDDYAMLREVLTRRFKRLQKEENSHPEAWPDMVLIDGGEGQLGVAAGVFAELDVKNVAYAAIAKGPDRNAGREWLHLPGRAPFQLDPADPLLHYLQRLRDEAHRFAIGSHRIRRSNALRESALDRIPNIGAARKKALLRHFGSSGGVEAASLNELGGVKGINKKIAEKIYNFFRS
jgi:excinuclease ABC subunit C